MLFLASTAAEIKELWLEYEDCTSEEARVVKDFDKLEMIVQADEYEQGERHHVHALGESRTYVQEVLLLMLP